MFSRSWLAVAMVFALATSTQAQRGGVITLSRVTLQGKVVQVGRGAIMITAGDGKNWTIKITNSSQIKVTGAAEPDMLVPGMYVRFTAPMDKQGRAKEKVRQITIFTPSNLSADRAPGVRKLGDIGDLGPDLAKPGKKAERPAKKGPPADDDPMAPSTNADTYDVRAQIATCKNRKLTVNVQSQLFRTPKLSLELTPDATIDLDLGDFTYVKPGEMATVQALTAQPGSAIAEEVEIVLAEPLSRSGKKARRPAARQPAEVAERPGKGKAKARPGVAAEEEEAPAATKPGGKGAKGHADEDIAGPVAEGDKPEQIRKLIEPTPEDIQGKGPLQVPTADGKAQVFTPCKPRSAEKLREKFGKPDYVSNLNGTLPDGRQIAWKKWGYGALTIFIDENGSTIYYNWAKTDEKKEEKPQE